MSANNDYSEEFDRLRRNRVEVSHHKYGPARKNFGEGRVDATSANGKLLSGVGRLALRHQKPVIALTGGAGEGSQALEALGIRAVVPIADGPISLEQSLTEAARLITDAAERTARLLRVGTELSGHF